MKPIRIIQSRAMVLEEKDIDTDTIIPARYLQTTKQDGLGNHLFADRMSDSAFPLRNYHGEKILLAGANFGCGSSREHAVWSLLEFGFRVIIAPSFGDIFRQNSVKNGLLTISLAQKSWSTIRQEQGDLVVDLSNQVIQSTSNSIPFAIDEYAKFCLSRGLDDFAVLQKEEDKIRSFEDNHHHILRPVFSTENRPPEN